MLNIFGSKMNKIILPSATKATINPFSQQTQRLSALQRQALHLNSSPRWTLHLNTKRHFAAWCRLLSQLRPSQPISPGWIYRHGIALWPFSFVFHTYMAACTHGPVFMGNAHRSLRMSRNFKKALLDMKSSIENNLPAWCRRAHVGFIHSVHASVTHFYELTAQAWKNSLHSCSHSSSSSLLCYFQGRLPH